MPYRKPINKLAALGVSYRNTNEENAYIMLPYKQFKGIAKRNRKRDKEGGNILKPLCYYYNELAKTLGFNSLHHYQEFINVREEIGELSLKQR